RLLVPGLSTSPGHRSVGNDCVDRVRHGDSLAGLYQKTRFVFDDHLWNPANVRGDDRQSCSHCFHDDRRKIVHAALGIDHTWEHKNICRGKTSPELRLRLCTSQYDTPLQTVLCDFVAQIVFKWASAHDFASERFAMFREQRACTNQIAESF